MIDLICASCRTEKERGPAPVVGDAIARGDMIEVSAYEDDRMVARAKCKPHWTLSNA